MIFHKVKDFTEKINISIKFNVCFSTVEESDEIVFMKLLKDAGDVLTIYTKNDVIKI